MSGGANDDRSVAERLLSILDAFDRSGTVSLRLSEIAARAGLPLSTAHRLVARFVVWGGLERTDDGAYQLGLKLWRLASHQPTTRQLRQVALPYLEDLLELTRQNVQIAVRDGLAALYLDRLAARDSVLVLADVGRRLPLHATGVGLVLLAHAPADVLDRVLAAPPRRYLPATMTTEAALRPRLDQIRRTGLAETREEMTPGSASVAAPIRGVDGQVLAALSVIVSSAEPVEPSVRLAVRLAANGISRGLGWVR